MKKVIFAILLGTGIISFSMAGINHSTAPVNSLSIDTIPTDTAPSPVPHPDTTLMHIQ